MHYKVNKKMRPEACQEVANRSRIQAEHYLQKGNPGRAFAHFLVALKLCPSWKIELSHNFTYALCSWGETLDEQKRYRDLFNCYEQALEVFPDNEEVLNSLGSHLYRLGHTTEACNYFRYALTCNPGFLPARCNLQGSCNLLVERWHFRMLNDITRNDAYRAAIIRRVVQQGADTAVLDIGTGTGLLSLFAVEAGAGPVFACDCSSTMINIASRVLRANGVSDKVTLINKHSNDITIPTDIPERVSLVVTETVDAGLLGEGILQSLIHAWDHLLLPPQSADGNGVSAGRVVPGAATLWIAPIECLHIARKYRLLTSDFVQKETYNNSSQVQDETHSNLADQEIIQGFGLNKLTVIVKRDEPYDTEDLNTIPGGYKFLAAPYEALHIKFDQKKDMSDWFSGRKRNETCLTCCQSGRVDAVVAWFDLHLDDVTTISSAPEDAADNDREGVHRANCWDQAVFPLHSSINVTSGQTLNFSIICQGGKISVICDENIVKDIHTVSKLQDSFSSSKISIVQNESQVVKDSDNSLPTCSGSSASKFANESNMCQSVRRERHMDRSVKDCNEDREETNIHSEEPKLVVPDISKCIDSSETEYLDDLKSFINECKSKTSDDNIVMSQDAICFLNDEQWMRTLQIAAMHLHQELHNRQISTILDISPFPVFGLYFLKRYPVKLVNVISSPEDKMALRKIGELNGVTTTQLECVTEKQLPEILDNRKIKFDVVITHLVDPSGELKETIFNMLPLLRWSLADGGVFLPQHFSVMGQLMESKWLAQVSHVENNSRTCGYDIARFINEYQGSQHLDLNLIALNATFLSNPTELLHINLDKSSCQTTQTTSVVAIHSGMLNAIAYWYSIQFHETAPVVHTSNINSHVNQAAILLQPHIRITEGHDVQLLVRFHEGLIHIEPLQEAEGGN
ncbi:protein arginine N-methyltransferase 9-like isoform X2 [Periplaneta americana]|uniref:protein arginine N-methyltransferase 9-like isoform X2 n=1 Tax=Periplaneta americana TaxID=6978 RepID=UPI0037E70969